MARKSAATSLELARKALEDIGTKLDELAHKREDRLLAGDDAATIRALDNEIDALEHARRTEVDRIKLLEGRAKQEEAARVMREREGLIKRLESKLAARDAVGAELQTKVAEAEKLFRRMIDLSEQVVIAWPWGTADYAPALLTGSGITTALQHELYRVGARPFLGGAPGLKVAVNFPGAKCPDHRLMGMPEQIPPLVENLAQASRYASDLMRGRRDTSGPISGATEQPAPAAVPSNGIAEPLVAAPPASPALPGMRSLSELLTEQHRLAMSTDPADALKYEAVVREIAALQ